MIGTYVIVYDDLSPIVNVYNQVFPKHHEILYL